MECYIQNRFYEALTQSCSTAVARTTCIRSCLVERSVVSEERARAAKARFDQPPTRSTKLLLRSLDALLPSQTNLRRYALRHNLLGRRSDPFQLVLPSSRPIVQV